MTLCSLSRDRFTSLVKSCVSKQEPFLEHDAMAVCVCRCGLHIGMICVH